MLNEKSSLKRRSLNIPLAKGSLSPIEKEVKRKNDLVTKSHKRKALRSFGASISHNEDD